VRDYLSKRVYSLHYYKYLEIPFQFVISWERKEFLVHNSLVIWVISEDQLCTGLLWLNCLPFFYQCIQYHKQCIYGWSVVVVKSHKVVDFICTNYTARWSHLRPGYIIKIFTSYAVVWWLQPGMTTSFEDHALKRSDRSQK